MPVLPPPAAGRAVAPVPFALPEGAVEKARGVLFADFIGEGPGELTAYEGDEVALVVAEGIAQGTS